MEQVNLNIGPAGEMAMIAMAEGNIGARRVPGHPGAVQVRSAEPMVEEDVFRLLEKAGCVAWVVDEWRLTDPGREYALRLRRLRRRGRPTASSMRGAA